LSDGARLTWGLEAYAKNRAFLSRASEAAALLQEKACQAGHRSNFSKGKFFAAATLAIKAHVYDTGVPIRRKAHELYVYHMLRIQERLAQADVPYLGGDAYVAVWLHDTVEDTSLSLENIERVFGRRVSGIVNVLTNLKTSKQETKFQQAGRYEPRFISSTMDYLEALYIKMADLDDYFNTCDRLSPESKFYHFRFVDEVVYPLAVAVVGAREMAVAVANKAMAVAHPDYAKYAARFKQIQTEPIQSVTRLITEALNNNGLQAEVKAVLRTPYEMLLKERAESAEEKWLFRRRQQLPESYDLPPSPKEEGPSLTERDLFFFDIITQDPLACYQARALLSVAKVCGPLLPERSRDFIEHPKPNGYRALHLEFAAPLRVRIFSREMETTNRLGMAAGKVPLSATTPLVSPLLSEETLELVQIADRESRRHLLQKLPAIREVEIQTMSHFGKIKVAHRARVDQRSNWFELAAACNPDYPFRLASGLWDGETFRDAQLGESFRWFTGQKVALTLAQKTLGHDVYSFVREPSLLEQLKKTALGWSTADQISLGKKMLARGIRAAAARGVDLFSYLDIHTQLDAFSVEDPWFEEASDFLEDTYKINWVSADDFYRKIATGAAALPDIIGVFFVTRLHALP